MITVLLTSWSAEGTGRGAKSKDFLFKAAAKGPAGKASGLSASKLNKMTRVTVKRTDIILGTATSRFLRIESE